MKYVTKSLIKAQEKGKSQVFLESKTTHGFGYSLESFFVTYLQNIF